MLVPWDPEIQSRPRSPYSRSVQDHRYEMSEHHVVALQDQRPGAVCVWNLDYFEWLRDEADRLGLNEELKKFFPPEIVDPDIKGNHIKYEELIMLPWMKGPYRMGWLAAQEPSMTPVADVCKTLTGMVPTPDVAIWKSPEVLRGLIDGLETLSCRGAFDHLYVELDELMKAAGVLRICW